MVATSKVALILGVGKRVGASLVDGFSSQGYKVAVAARTPQKEITDNKDRLAVVADLTDPASVENIFDQVEQAYVPPNVVVYNAASAHFVPADDPLQLTVSGLNQDFALNAAGAIAAARRAVQGFVKLPASAKRTFIYTGNFLKIEARPAFLSVGMTKSAASHLVKTASIAYDNAGYRKADGDAVYGNVDGPAHADFYLTLAESEERLPWLATFVEGKGYAEFPSALA